MSTPHGSTRRTAFTLIECLVAISIIGLIAGLLIPAVLGARESAHRLECSNRLKQLGIAFHTHAAIHLSFPCPMPARHVTSQGVRYATPETLSGNYELLPYLEAMPIYNSINVHGLGTSTGMTFSPTSPENRSAYSTKLGQFLCPADASRIEHAMGPTSYRFNVGSRDPVVLIQPPEAGAFDPSQPRSAGGFRDGLSSTIGMSERLRGHAGGPFDRQRSYWCAGVSQLVVFDSGDKLLSLCRGLRSAPSSYISNMGGSWMHGGNIYLWYNHVAPPNDAGSDCSTGDGNSSDPLYCHTCSVAARSYHRGGVNCLAMDGTVHFVRDSVNLALWRASATHSGSDVTTTEW